MKESLELIIKNQTVLKALDKALNSNWDLTRDIHEELEYYRGLVRETIDLNKNFISANKDEKC